MSQFTIRPAKPEETGLVLDFIKKLAVYEKCADEVVADEATLYNSLFVERSAEVVFAEEDGVVIGFALFFHNFSTFVGRKGLYLEDLFILPEKRGRGYGKALLKYLAKLAVERNCGRMEWICLDWNGGSTIKKACEDLQAAYPKYKFGEGKLLNKINRAEVEKWAGAVK